MLISNNKIILKNPKFETMKKNLTKKKVKRKKNFLHSQKQQLASNNHVASGWISGYGVHMPFNKANSRVSSTFFPPTNRFIDKNRKALKKFPQTRRKIQFSQIKFQPSKQKNCQIFSKTPNKTTNYKLKFPIINNNSQNDKNIKI